MSPSAPHQRPKNDWSVHDFSRPLSSYVKLPQASSSTAEKLCFHFLAMASIFAMIAAERRTCFLIFPSGLRPEHLRFAPHTTAYFFIRAGLW
jgi:hypothetical protein